MGTRVHVVSQVSWVSAIVVSAAATAGADYAAVTHVLSSGKQSLSSGRVGWKKLQCRKSRSSNGEFGGDGTVGYSQNSFTAAAFRGQRKVGTVCSLSNSNPVPQSSGSSSAASGAMDSVGSGSHSSSLPPPSAVSLGTSHGSTFINGASSRSFLESMTSTEGSFLQSVTATESLDLTEGVEVPLHIYDDLEDQNGALLDPELQGILANIADMQKQNEMLNEQMKMFQQLLTKTTRSLNVKAQEAKIEAVKLKKLAKLHQLEEIRRQDEVRRKILEARIQEELKERTFLEKAFMSQPVRELGDEPALEDGSSAEESGAEEVELKHDSGPDTVVEKESVPESLECVISHPGALSCTKTVIKSDLSKKSAVVMMETTVSCAGDACLLTSLDEDDYVALAVQTLADTAQELKTTRFQRATVSDPVQSKKHNAIAEILSKGRIVKARPMEPPSKFGHESFVVQLLDKESGQKCDAMCKPGIEGHADGWHRAAIELVAYELNRMLGMDYVPPVAYRSGGVDVNYKHYNDGAFVYYVPNTVSLRKVPATSWGVSVAMLLSDTRILDVLLNNSDRHHGHFLFGEHWADGKMRPVLIDHAAGFRKEAVVKMDHENAFQTGPVRCVSSRTYLRLRFLETLTIESKFKGILSSEEVNKMMQRRDQILSYLDNLVAERGYHKTVIEN